MVKTCPGREWLEDGAIGFLTRFGVIGECQVAADCPAITLPGSPHDAARRICHVEPFVRGCGMFNELREANALNRSRNSCWTKLGVSRFCSVVPLFPPGLVAMEVNPSCRFHRGLAPWSNLVPDLRGCATCCEGHLAEAVSGTSHDSEKFRGIKRSWSLSFFRVGSCLPVFEPQGSDVACICLRSSGRS